jgi:hypothetical protein
MQSFMVSYPGNKTEGMPAMQILQLGKKYGEKERGYPTMKSLILGLFLLALIGGAQAENIYTPIPITTPEPFGELNINVRCHHNLISQEMKLTSITNNEEMSVYLNPDGTYDTILVPGDYALILIDGNGGQTEYRYFTIQSGYSVQISFIGHAVTFDPVTTITPTPTLIPSVIPTTEPTPTPTVIPTVTPTPIPTVTPTPTETITPLPTPTILPTITPSPSPTPVITPTPTPICHEEKICTPGWWGPWIPDTWHPEECQIVVVCE